MECGSLIQIFWLSRGMWPRTPSLKPDLSQNCTCPPPLPWEPFNRPQPQTAPEESRAIPERRADALPLHPRQNAVLQLLHVVGKVDFRALLLSLEHRLHLAELLHSVGVGPLSHMRTVLRQCAAGAIRTWGPERQARKGPESGNGNQGLGRSTSWVGDCPRKAGLLWRFPTQDCIEIQSTEFTEGQLRYVQLVH